jgi:guanylate kinase
MKKKGRLFVVAGPSGTGKDTLIEEVVKDHDLQMSISVTTRKPRPGEVDGRDYTFVTDREFENLVDRGAFLEWKEVFGRRYGTLAGEVDRVLASGRDVILEIDVKGALEVKSKVPEAKLIFIKPPSLEELKARLRGRGADEEEEISARMEVAPGEMVIGEEEFDVIIVNDEINRAAGELAKALER